MKTLKLEVKNAQNGNSTVMEVDRQTKMQEILDSSVEFWSLADEAYLLKSGRKLLAASRTVEECGLSDGDIVELLPDPEGG